MTQARSQILRQAGSPIAFRLAQGAERMVGDDGDEIG